MKIHFLEAIDCTSDAHYAEFAKETRDQIADVILKVCESNLVQNIESVTLEVGSWEHGNSPEGFKTDDFSISDLYDKNKRQMGKFAKKHKIEGLYFGCDADVDAKHHLPPGLTGVRYAVTRIKTLPENQRFHLDVRVVWAFSGDSSCSDYIQWPDSESTGSMTAVNFSNQDSWIGMEGYKDHCTALSRLICHEITPHAGYGDKE